MILSISKYANEQQRLKEEQQTLGIQPEQNAEPVAPENQDANAGQPV